MLICPLEVYQLRVQRLRSKVKQLPDSAAYSGSGLSLSLSLSLADLALSRPVLRVSLSPRPFILRVPLDPAGAGPRHLPARRSAHTRPPKAQTDRGPAQITCRPADLSSPSRPAPSGSVLLPCSPGVQPRRTRSSSRVPIRTCHMWDSPSYRTSVHTDVPSRPREGDLSKGSPSASQPAPAASLRADTVKISQGKTPSASHFIKGR